MKKPFSFFLFLSAILLILFITAGKSLAGYEYVQGEVLVKFRDTAGITAVQNLHSAVKATKKNEFSRLRIHQVKLAAGMSVEEAVKRYKEDANVEYAEPNYIVHALATPNDTSFSQLWGLHNTGQSGGTADADIDAPEAWDITTGSDSVIIAVVDTGVAYNHSDFSNNIWRNEAEISGVNGFDDDNNGYIDDFYGWDFVDNDGAPLDLNEHGTHVAGTIAAQGNNALGITGVMWNAKIMPVRFLGLSGSGTTSDAILGIKYAVDNGAKIINNSWGGGGYSQSLKDAIEIYGSDALFVCAAGNSGRGADVSYPAKYDSPNIISVAATDNTDTIAWFSSYSVVDSDLGAPGVSIYSTIPLYTDINPFTVYSENFDGNSGPLPSFGAGTDMLGWQRGGTNPAWAVNTGTGVGGSNSLEDSPGSNYLNNTLSTAGYTASVTSQQGKRYTLEFDWKGELEDGWDFLDIKYTFTDGRGDCDNIHWDWIDYRTGNTNGSFMLNDTADLTPIAETYDKFCFGFGMDADDSITYDGVYVDNVKLVTRDIIISGYDYANYSGTSMATPHVSGAAGLILSNSPSLTNLQVKSKILNNADAVPGLSGKVLTGGRLNAYRALAGSAPPPPPSAPSNLSAVSVSTSQINLTWSDNSSNETGFKIERKTGSSGTYSEIKSVGQNVTSYSNTGLSAFTTYYYRVRSYNNTSGNSSYSNTANATTGVEGSGGSGGGGGGGGCFIATAAYGSYLAPEVSILREFRDRRLLTNSIGRKFVSLYYRYSPPIADFIKENEWLKFGVRALLLPVILTLKHPLASSAFFLSIFLIVISQAIIKKERLR
ncbi:MAG: S8 family serine peptidase [Nitrospirae bacterium]|nr:S8 family serine peptidase [Nitrospirota bacterium]